LGKGKLRQMNWKKAVQHQLQAEKNKIVTIDLEKAEVDYSDHIKKYEDPRGQSAGQV